MKSHRPGAMQAAASLALLLLMACSGGGSSKPVGPNPNCIEIDKGSVACQAALDTWVIRTQEEYDTFLEQCSAFPIPPEDRPPVPAGGEVLLVTAVQGTGCSGCMEVTCVSSLWGETRTITEGAFEGDCDMIVSLGAWALAPDRAVRYTFQYEDIVSCP